MFALSKITSLLLILGLVNILVVDALPTYSAEEEFALSARTIKGNPKCKGKVGKASKGAKAPATHGRPKGKRLVRRTSHPDPTHSIKLYHGSASDFDFDHSKSTQNGDLHYGKPGFYMTDTPESAAHYACLSHCLEKDQSATVLEFQWDGSTNVHTFPSTTDATWAAYQKWVDANYNGESPSPKPEFTTYHNMDMLSGPMKTTGDVLNGVNPDFWQYVLLNPTAASKLHKIGSRTVACNTVAKYD